MRVIIVGDIHGDFGSLNELIAAESPDYILQCGDFGYFPRECGGWPPKDPPIVPGSCKVHFADGNHEDHDALARAVSEGRLEAPENVFYQPRGSVLTLPDGRNVLFLGGAEATPPREPIDGVVIEDSPVPPLSVDVIASLPSALRVDVVISHTCPLSFELNANAPYGYEPEVWSSKFNDVTRTFLEHVFQAVRPRRWYFGHFHVYERGMSGGCEWCALGCSEGKEEWWDVWG